MKSKGVAYLFWFLGFFGLLGFHRFYLSKTGTGFLWLFSFGVLGAGALFDLFTLGSQVDQYNTKEELKVIRAGSIDSLASNKYNKLTALGELKEKGTLTQEEFDAEKQAIMNSSPAEQSPSRLLANTKKETDWPLLRLQMRWFFSVVFFLGFLASFENPLVAFGLLVCGLALLPAFDKYLIERKVAMPSLARYAVLVLGLVLMRNDFKDVSTKAEKTQSDLTKQAISQPVTAKPATEKKSIISEPTNQEEEDLLKEACAYIDPGICSTFPSSVKDNKAIIFRIYANKLLAVNPNNPKIMQLLNKCFALKVHSSLRCYCTRSTINKNLGNIKASKLDEIKCEKAFE